MKEKTAITIKGLPYDLYCQFKAICARRGITVKDRIIELMKKETKEKED